MSALDRRQFLVRTGQAAAAVGAASYLAGADFEEAADAKTPNISGLRKVVKGKVYTKSTPGFAAERTVFNKRFAGQVPLAVVRASSAADVAATIKWAAYYGVPIAARSGGHSYAGYSSPKGGVVVDLRSLHNIKLGSGGVAQIGAGNNLWSIYSTLSRKGKMIPGGSCPTVGIAGLALGGGMGLAARKYGLTLDNVKGVQVVTADGKVRNASPKSNEDLYWACRGGGGGNFGIATAFSIQTHAAPTCAWFYGSWSWSRAEEVLGAWLRFAPKSSASLTSLCTLLAGDPPKATVFGQFFGTEAQLRKVLAPFLKDAPGGSVSYGTASYMNLVRKWAGCSSDAQCSAYAPEAFNAGSAYVAKPFSSAGLKAATRAVERGGSLLFDGYGGAINNVSPSKTAFAHRNMLACIQYYANGSGTSWLAAAKKDMKPYVSSSAYVNYIDPTVKGYQTAYYGTNLTQLRKIKKKYDKNNLFRFKQSITPAS
jgi:FAD/FMN-containing dehydrogenase